MSDTADRCRYVISKTQGETNNRKGGISESGGRKGRAAADEQVVEAMSPQVRVDYSLTRIDGHARRSNVMRPSNRLPSRFAGVITWSEQQIGFRAEPLANSLKAPAGLGAVSIRD